MFLEEKLKTVDFLEVIGISKTAYYAIKNGKTKKLSVDNAKKITNAFNKYSYNWLMEIDEVDNDINTSKLIKTSIGFISRKEFAHLAAEHVKSLKEENVFYNTLIIESLELLKEAQDSKGKIDSMKLSTRK